MNGAVRPGVGNGRRAHSATIIRTGSPPRVNTGPENPDPGVAMPASSPCGGQLLKKGTVLSVENYHFSLQVSASKPMIGCILVLVVVLTGQWPL